MGRPREFDIDEARKKAMNVFWETGYKGTSLPDLLAGAGLSRGSLYKAFGNKKSLFVEALTFYDETVWKPGIRLLEDDVIPEGKSRIELFFSNAVSLVEEGDRRGCLLCNAAVGAASEDPEIEKIVSRMLADLTLGFAEALRSSKNFMNKSKTNLVDRASGITLSYIGLRVSARSGMEAPMLRKAYLASLQDI